MMDLCREHGIAPDLMAGYSFGIYAAMYGSGALSYADGAAAVGRAFDLMDTASRGRDYTMALTIGLTAGEIDAILSSGYYDRLCMVNSNNDTCKVFAGPRSSLVRFVEEARVHDAIDARFLDVSIPYHHSRLLDGVSGAFHSFLQTLTWSPPLCPIVSSIDQGLLASADELIDFTAANLCTPINWERVAAALHGCGVTRAVECGPGISLTQNGRFMPFHIEYINLKTMSRKLGL
jgi:[acyl-carrier-protein] S-malonyltransferase